MGIDGASMEVFDAMPGHTLGSRDALRLLKTRFPEFSDLFSDPDDPDLEPSEPHYSYGIFAREVLERRHDARLLDRVTSLINEMVVSKAHILEYVVAVTVLEQLADDPEMAPLLYPKIVPEAQETLRAIERDLYGRAQ
jgi:hypothetical protein